MKKLVPQAIKNIYHLAQAVLANFIYGWPAKSIKVIGVTGTDGKTTTCQMIAAILEEAGCKVAMASTVNFKIGGRAWKNLSHLTTLSSFTLQKFILNAVKERCEYAVLEVSSHSLDQYRTWGIRWKTAVITNVTREHLDYHKTMEKYRAAKMKLFQETETAVINLDMENPEEFLQLESKKKITYSLKNKQATILADNLSLGLDKTTFSVRGQNFILYFPGDFNAENALAATAACLAENISLETCALALSKIEQVPGRLESVPNELGLNIVVDFALTPEALKRIYKLFTGIKKPWARIIAVFGACGERDRGKRPIIGEIVSRYADYMVLTNDEPYREDPRRIIGEIAAGIKNKKENENIFVIPDRREAIRKALEIAKADDIIAVTGMGAFESMVIGTQKIPWNDKKVILEELQKI